PPRRRFVQVRGIEDVAMAVNVHETDLVDGGGQWFSAAGVRPLPPGAVADAPPPEGHQAGGAVGAGPAGPFGAAPWLLLRPEAVAPNAIEAVLGESVARELGGDVGKPRLEVGDVFDLGGRKWVVSGVMKTEGTAYGSEIWCNKTKAEDWGKKGTFTTM